MADSARWMFPDEAVHRAARDGQVDARERLHPAEPLRDLAQLDERPVHAAGW